MLVDAVGLQCASPSEVANWMELAVKQRTANFGTFCSDADSAWCRRMEAAGKCVRSQGRQLWKYTQDPEDEEQG